MESQPRTSTDSEYDNHDRLCGFAWRALVDTVDCQYRYADRNPGWQPAMAVQRAIRVNLNSTGHQHQCLPQVGAGWTTPQPRYRPVFFCELVWLVRVSCPPGSSKKDNEPRLPDRGKLHLG